MAEIDVWIQRPRGASATYVPREGAPLMGGAARCVRLSSMVGDFTEGLILGTRHPATGLALPAMLVFPGDDDPGLQAGAVVECRALGCIRLRPGGGLGGLRDDDVQTIMILTPTTGVMSSASLMEDAAQFSDVLQLQLRRAAMLTYAVRTPGYDLSSGMRDCTVEGMVRAITAYVECVDPGVD